MGDSNESEMFCNCFVDRDRVAHLPAQGSSCPVVQDPEKREMKN